jgi:hypothetical protein
MKAEIQREEGPLVEPDGHGDQSGGEDQIDVPPAEGKDAACSAVNIARWRSYLPKSCIDTMISMGWDRTT